MNAFQVVSTIGLGLLTIREIKLMRHEGVGGRLFPMLVWPAAIVAIWFPDAVTMVANLLGIGKGADLVSYLFVLMFIITTYYFYSRYRRLQIQLTELVRQAAIEKAQQQRGTAIHES